MITRRSMAKAGLAAPMLFGSASAWAQATAPSLEELARAPIMHDASLSPDGSQIAVLREIREGGKRTTFVDLIDAANPRAAARSVIIGDHQGQFVQWASDERLLISIFIEQQQEYVPTGSIMRQNFTHRFRRIISVGVDGRDPVVLFGDQKEITRYNYDLGRIVSLLPDDPRRILMTVWDAQHLAMALHHVDVYTGRSTLLERGALTGHWHIRDGVPVARIDFNLRGTVGALMVRPPGETDWTLVRRIVRRTEFDIPDFDIVANGDEPGEVLARMWSEEEPTIHIRAFDLRTGRSGGLRAARPDTDVHRAILDSNRNYLGAVYVEDRLVFEFEDPTLTAHHRGMDRFFEGECNVALFDANADRSRFLAWVSGPRVPRALFFYDVRARRFENLGFARPWLRMDRLAKVEPLDVRTRDGAALRAYLTVPNAAGPRPLVVMPHGGPEARDWQDFDVVAQAFAAQGWLVLQPNFRGSGGYGRAFAEAGHRRWADRMQEDVEDAAAQVIASGRADPAKVAIWGASYGGYAALMGAVRRPEFYRAAVSFAGVSDLDRMLAFEREDGEDSPSYQYWVKRIGDPKTDAAMIRSASPRFRVDEIAAPVLLIHGVDDEIVPRAQSRLMADALKRARKPHEHIELKETGHWTQDPKVLQQILERSVAFIAKSFA